MFLGKAVERIRAVALVSLDTLAILLTPRGTPNSDRVVIARGDEIGDFILWINAAQALVQHYKVNGKTVILIANQAWAAWARDLAIFDDVLAVNVQRFQREPMYRYRVAREIRKLGCAVAVAPSYSHNWLLGDSMIRVSGAKVRIGSIGDKSTLRRVQRRIANRWYTELIAAAPSPCTELERNAEFVRNLANVDHQPRLADLRKLMTLQLDDAFTSAIAGEPYYVLFPGASWEGRQWPISNFAEIAEKLHRKRGWRGVVCGGPSDVQLAETLCARSSTPLMNWAGRTDLPQLTAILSASQLLLTNETSAVHLAAACGTPTVCLLGGGHYGRFMPYPTQQIPGRTLPRTAVHSMPCFGCNWECIYERPPGTPVPCIERIGVAEVWQAISDTLEEASSVAGNQGDVQPVAKQL